MKIGITFASVPEEYEKDPFRALDEIAAAGYEVMEVAPDHIERGELRRALDQRGLKAVGGHFIWPSFEDDKYEDTLHYAAALGTDTLVIPWCYPETIADYESTVQMAKKLDELAAKVGKRGFKLAYHNHWMEFENVYNGKCIEDIFLENTSLLGFELDIGWAFVGGCADLPAYVQKLGKRLSHLHIKDVNADKLPVEIGTGLVDIRACMDAAAAVGVEYGIVEQDVGPDKRAYPAFESIRISRENLRGFGY